MASPTFDLQAHSTWSDGDLPPAEVVARAAAAGVELLSLTDHDDIDGTDEALAAAAEHGLRCVPGVEISALDDQARDLHILGYGVDHRDPELRAALATYRDDRDARASRMIARLRDLGFVIDDADIRARQADGKPVGRPHIADAVYHHPANAERLRAEGIHESAADVLVAYLIQGTPAYSGRSFPTVVEAIDAIHAAGGVAVWAHPFWDIDAYEGVEQTLRSFVADGLDGVEAFYVEHNERQTHFLCDLADELDLLTTGSADFHAPGHKYFNRFRAFELYGREPRLGPIAG